MSMTDEIQRAQDSNSDACTATERASRSAQHAGSSMDIMALHLHLILINRQLSLIAARPGIASRRHV